MTSPLGQRRRHRLVEVRMRERDARDEAHGNGATDPVHGVLLPGGGYGPSQFFPRSRRDAVSFAGLPRLVPSPDRGLRRKARLLSMSTSARRVHYTYAQYLALEDEASPGAPRVPGRRDLRDGRGSPDHAVLAVALIGILRGSCRPRAGSHLGPPGADRRRRAVHLSRCRRDMRPYVVGRRRRPRGDEPGPARRSDQHFHRGVRPRRKAPALQGVPSLREVLFVSHRGPEGPRFTGAKTRAG